MPSRNALAPFRKEVPPARETDINIRHRASTPGERRAYTKTGICYHPSPFIVDEAVAQVEPAVITPKAWRLRVTSKGVRLLLPANRWRY